VPLQLDAAAQIALITYPFLIFVLGGFLRSMHKDLKEAIEAEKISRAANYESMKRLIETESLARGASLTAIRAEMQRTDDRALSLQREIDKDYVNYDRLLHALRPINESLSEIKRDQERLFERLDGKVDKEGVPHVRRKMDGA
jgi:septation ring formation regulator EzrA